MEENEALAERGKKGFEIRAELTDENIIIYFCVLCIGLLLEILSSCCWATVGSGQDGGTGFVQQHLVENHLVYTLRPSTVTLKPSSHPQLSNKYGQHMSFFSPWTFTSRSLSVPGSLMDQVVVRMGQWVPRFITPDHEVYEYPPAAPKITGHINLGSPFPGNQGLLLVQLSRSHSKGLRCLRTVVQSTAARWLMPLS